ncbi:MAG: hypothetical protein MRERV_46c012 [Mycoplasmataceae bacterium RV_VA103A]|nr:MAG: hypothetical protein MRERV_46c012 [Mycoplasmataceae bacterium RV_VA103A]
MKARKKHLFKAKHYCANCQQRKVCGLLDKGEKYCCACYCKLWEELEEEGLLISEAWKVLNDYRTGVINCRCKEAEKPRVSCVNSDGSGWSRCEGCEKFIGGAGHHGVVKNRNDPGFWGLSIEYKILCLKCLGKKYYSRLDRGKKHSFRKYLRRGYD